MACTWVWNETECVLNVVVRDLSMPPLPRDVFNNGGSGGCLLVRLQLPTVVDKHHTILCNSGQAT